MSEPITTTEPFLPEDVGHFVHVHFGDDEARGFYRGPAEIVGGGQAYVVQSLDEEITVVPVGIVTSTCICD
jgi:hypothetical protein